MGRFGLGSLSGDACHRNLVLACALVLALGVRFGGLTSGTLAAEALAQVLALVTD